MRKVLLILTVTMLLTASAAFAQYTGPWTQTWDFNDGLQGWSMTAGGGSWIDPVQWPTGPTLPDNLPSGAGGGNVYTPDGTIFQIAMPGGTAKSFVLEADVYIPNLGGLAGDTYFPGNGLNKCGIGVTGGGKYAYVGGRGDRHGMRMRDNSWDNVNRERSWLMEEAGVAKLDMWDDWVKMQFVYNLNNSGMFTAYIYTPWDSAVHDGPGWYKFADYAIHPSGPWSWDTIRIGSVSGDGNSWTQAQIDNVKVYNAVPEPSSMFALATGIASMAGFAIRRRK